MSDIVIHTVKRITTSHAAVLDDVKLIAALRALGLNIPDSATLYFSVPGGGDWSNTTINICEENPISVEWFEQSVEYE